MSENDKTAQLTTAQGSDKAIITIPEGIIKHLGGLPGVIVWGENVYAQNREAYLEAGVIVYVEAFTYALPPPEYHFIPLGFGKSVFIETIKGEPPVTFTLPPFDKYPDLIIYNWGFYRKGISLRYEKAGVYFADYPNNEPNKKLLMQLWSKSNLPVNDESIKDLPGKTPEGWVEMGKEKGFIPSPVGYDWAIEPEIFKTPPSEWLAEVQGSFPPATGYKGIKIYKVNLYDWVAAPSLESAKHWAERNGTDKEELGQAQEIAPGNYDKLIFNYEDGRKAPFSVRLREICDMGQNFPCFFASTEE